MELSQSQLLKEAKAFHAKKRLGQHFLISPDALQLIADAVSATAGDTVIEIGPGIGFLTRLLANTGARIIAVDLDDESVERLRQSNYPNVEIKHGDFLRFDLNTLDFYRGKPAAASGDASQRLKVIGNVPYQITGLILGHVLGELDKASPWIHRIDSIALTIQREVAQRLVATPGSDAYSRVSLLINYYCEASLQMIVPPDAFYPAPEVTSAIVKLVPRKQPPVAPANLKLMKQIIDAGFRQRRKMLRNSLSFTGLPGATVDAIFKKLSFDPQVRAERLSLQQFAMLADAFNEQLKSNANDKSARSGEG